MNIVDLRDALIARLVDNFQHTEVPLFYEGTEDIDLDAITGDYLVRAKIDWGTAVPVGMGSRQSRMKRQYGRLTLLVFNRQGTGDRQKTVYMSELDNIFGMAMFGGVTTEAPSPSRSVEQGGWGSTTFSVPFFADIELSTI